MKHAATGHDAKTAEDFARIVNNQIGWFGGDDSDIYFANARAYPFKSIPKEHGKEVWDRLADLPGMKKACEIRYTYIDEDGKEIPQSGM